MEYLGYVAFFFMGSVLGLIGGGGSILTVPILVYMFDLPAETATGYSLLIVGMTSLVGLYSYLRRKEVDLAVGMKFLLPSLIGVYLSRGVILPRTPDIIFSTNFLSLSKDLLIMTLFAAIMIFASLKMIVGGETNQKNRGALSLSLRGLLVGAATGFIGAGGGFLITPALHFMAGLSMRTAVGTSLAVIAINSLFGFAVSRFNSHGEVHWLFLSLVSVLSMLGILLSSTLATRFSEAKLKKIFGFFVLVIGTFILLENLWFK